MRGGPLSNADVVKALQPFRVTTWSQENRAAPPPDVQKLYDKAGRMNSNIVCFVLDAKGEFLRAFNGFPNGANNPAKTPLADIARYWIDEIGKSGAKIDKRENPMTMPDVDSGVRVYVRLADPKMFESYRTPVVEVVADDGEWKLLEPGERTIDAAKFARWLKVIYPPGVNEQLKPFENVKGSLTLKPEGKDKAILSGKISMWSKVNADHPFEGTLEAVITYGKTLTLRGVVDGVYARNDAKHGGWVDWKLTAAIESRP